MVAKDSTIDFAAAEAERNEINAQTLDAIDRWVEREVRPIVK